MPTGETETLARASRVRLLTCDVDGVLTDGCLYLSDDGVEGKRFCVADGVGLRMLARSDIAIAWISGRRSAAVARRASELGIVHLIEGVDDKVTPWLQLLERLALEPSACAH